MKLHEFIASMESMDCSPLLTNNEIVHFQYWHQKKRNYNHNGILSKSIISYQMMFFHNHKALLNKSSTNYHI